jgi:hypothetical protein
MTIIKKTLRAVNGRLAGEAVKYALDMQAKGMTLVDTSEAKNTIVLTHEGELQVVDTPVSGAVLVDSESGAEVDELERIADNGSAVKEAVDEPTEEDKSEEAETVTEETTGAEPTLDWAHAETLDKQSLIGYLAGFDPNFDSKAKSAKSILKAAKKHFNV